MRLFRFLFFIITLTASMLAVVNLRTINSQQYYLCRRNVVKIEKLRNDLTDQRIEIERMINPKAVKQAAKPSGTEDSSSTSQ
ncbi:hypothetical protein [Sedimentisphaera salicampi]|uniref:Uncharacterized protein n=1 Tax=Sedimentisphaera salicampi TaxID=1941349 RepID=A0A1W6LNH3_9BACT|nr:hypothetical protein [Sedimentisphaera salicampi]ARN57335.1 hypothetical protein STSP1_01739 [Sedimentisphaera salicampi]OXU14648.1 hypothetical protein SMSP1_01653 [Sedimentisphaera salicampi]